MALMAQTAEAEWPRPQEVVPPAPIRRTLGPGYDWLLEVCRQLYRPALGLICLCGLARQFLFALPAERLDEVSLMVLAGLAGALAGIRAAELTFNRPAR
jgi:hypothetical protein